MKKIMLTIAAAALAAQGTAQGEAPDPETIRVGSTTEVWVLQESAGEGNTGVLIDAPAEVTERYAPGGVYPTATNAVLVRRGDRVTLIDAGYGRTIFEKMAGLGIAPEQVDEVLLTHMHGDHIGGMLRDGVSAFPNATVSLAQKEFDYWNEAAGKQALAVFEAYAGSLKMLSPVGIDSTIGEGITPVAAYGHTPGHTMFMIEDGGERLLVWGDLTHAMAVQMPRPEISVRYDVDPAAARESRLEVLRVVAAQGIPVVGMHIPATLPGDVTPDGTGYKFRSRE
jgi:glyoxylase-like metal-dependent hydrolase (beta-lactamase superfamily II)